jgi:3-hydroxyisobutyrate dehydrogenase-like beta-hydroxyacid dehydrogenase
MSRLPRVALIGFGEVGQVLAADLAAAGITAISAWDPLFADPSSGPSRASAAVRRGRDAADALVGAELVISAVTAAECLAAATTAAASLPPGALVLDLNSVAPATRILAATRIEAAGGRYVEAAVMSPILPRRSAAPMLLGGPHALAFLPLARALGFSGMQVYADTIGPASAAKMCRSVMVKGMEALLTESLLAARHYGVESAVLESLQDMFPGNDWPLLSRYMVSRSLQHGRRRAEEMREVAKTVAGAGLEPWMSSACAERQDWAGHHAALADEPDLAVLLDRLLASNPDRHGVHRC